MAKKGSSSHIKRLNAPKYFAIHRKEHRYIIKQNPGRHTLQRSVALSLLVEKIGLASNRSEANSIVRSGLVNVNGRKTTDMKYPVGLSDIITIGSESRIVKINKKGQIDVTKSDKHRRIYKVVGKYKYKQNRIMLRLHDGSAITGSNDANLDDSVVISDGKIQRLVKFNPGSKCEVIDGVHVGTTGTVKEISAGNIHKAKSVIIEKQDKGIFETLAKNIIVVE